MVLSEVYEFCMTGTRVSEAWMYAEPDSSLDRDVKYFKIFADYQMFLLLLENFFCKIKATDKQTLRKLKKS